MVQDRSGGQLPAVAVVLGNGADLLVDCLAYTAAELGYVPVGSYAQTMTAELDWLVSTAQERAGARQDLRFFDGHFDYSAEDRFLAGLQ